jgi:hypothetical protein
MYALKQKDDDNILKRIDSFETIEEQTVERYSRVYYIFFI